MTIPAVEAVGVRFYVYGWRDLPLALAAERVARALVLPFEHHASLVRGAYYRWSDDFGADVLVQGNVADEDGLPVERSHAGYGVLVYATGLDDLAYESLARVEGLQLLDADTVLVGSSHIGPALHLS